MQLRQAFVGVTFYLPFSAWSSRLYFARQAYEQALMNTQTRTCGVSLQCSCARPSSTTIGVVLGSVICSNGATWRLPSC
eukprot:4084915-Amphidinium_carterae.1